MPIRFLQGFSVLASVALPLSWQLATLRWPLTGTQSVYNRNGKAPFHWNKLIAQHDIARRICEGKQMKARQFGKQWRRAQ